MKYEVIGWTVDCDGDYEQHEAITAPVDAAIIKEIRKHGYLFGGDMHEEYCPILNDGTLVSYSWRGWGRIMALAHGLEETDYMYGYMDMLLKPEARKYPKRGLFEGARIFPREQLAETFTMHLNGKMFDAVKAGTKTIEVRLFDEKRKLIDIDDYIEFSRMGGGDERIKKRVADLFLEETFEELFESSTFDENGDWVRQFTPEQFGSPKGCTTEEFVDGMYQIYSKDDEEKYGVIGFLLEEP